MSSSAWQAASSVMVLRSAEPKPPEVAAGDAAELIPVTFDETGLAITGDYKGGVGAPSIRHPAPFSKGADALAR